MDDNAANQRVDAPPGARCAVHVDAPATVVCTRCGNYCCYECGVQYNASYLCTSCDALQREHAAYGDASKGQRFANFWIDYVAIEVFARGIGFALGFTLRSCRRGSSTSANHAAKWLSER